MVYRAIGIMSGSSLDGLDISFVEFEEQGGKWSFEIKEAACYAYEVDWKKKLQDAIHLNALEYQLLHTSYGHYVGEKVNTFINEKNLQYQVALIASHGHTTFHVPTQKMTAQLGDGAAIAAVTGLPVVSDLRAMDLAHGGQGAPIVPMGEKLLLGDYQYYLNLGGIANISFNKENYIAYDICAANRVLNMLAAELGKEYDKDGELSASGTINESLLNRLNELAYYKQPYPKSLANDFGTDIVFPMIKAAGISPIDGLRTYTEHIAQQIFNSVENSSNGKMLVTGGGALNKFLVERCSTLLAKNSIELVVPDEMLINYKEAMIMAFLGILRWREESTVLASVTGAAKSSVGGALWMGHEG